jgi:hypothetical protein
MVCCFGDYRSVDLCDRVTLSAVCRYTFSCCCYRYALLFILIKHELLSIFFNAVQDDPMLSAVDTIILDEVHGETVFLKVGYRL